MLQLRFLGGTVLGCRYAIPASLATPDHQHDRVVEHVEDALARVVIEHPALRLVAVKADTKRPAWVAVDQLDFTHHVQWADLSSDDGDGEGGGGADGSAEAVVSEETLRARIERCLDESYATEAEGPQWRVIILFKSRGDSVLDVIFDYSHALGDGMSGKIFHESLLRSLNHTSATPSPPAGTETSATPSALSNHILKIPSTARTLAPPVEKVGKFSISPKFALSTIWKELRPPKLASTSTRLAHWAPIRATPYRTHFRAFRIAADTLKQIQAACRAHGTTITGLLHALVLVPMAMHIPEKEAVAFTGSTPLDLRRHLVGSPEVKRLGFDPRRTIANYVSIMYHKFGAELVREIREIVTAKRRGNGENREDGEDRGGEERGDEGGDREDITPELVSLIWKCAARVRGEVQKRLDGGLKNDIASLMGLVPDWRAQHRMDAQKPRAMSWVVTNLGVLDGNLHSEPKSSFTDDTDNTGNNAESTAKVGNEGKEEKKEQNGCDASLKRESRERGESSWKITHSTFAISTEVNGAAFQDSPISVKNGAMCVGCSWQDCVVSLELAEAVVADMERWLLFLGRVVTRHDTIV